MKKSLIALAALAATTAFAQSSVTLTGTFDPSIANSSTTFADGKKVSNSFVRNNSQGTSQITFKGVEDLGGGMKASFLFENDFDTRYDANGNMGVSATASRGVNIGSGGGEQFLALEGGFGKVAVGAPNTPSLTAQASRQPFGTKIGGGFNSTMGTAHVRSNNSVVYTAPTLVTGLTVQAAYGFNHNAVTANGTGAIQQANTNLGASTTNSDASSNQTSITDIGLFYANGPLSAGVSMWNTAAVTSASTGATTPKVEQTNLFASYDLGVAKLTAGYHTEKQAAYTSSARPAGINATGYNLAAVVPFNANLSLLANFGQLTDDLASRATAKQNRKIAAVGLKYTLSKNTSVYARYVDETNDNVAAAFNANLLSATNTVLGANAKSIKTTLIGMQTNF